MERREFLRYAGVAGAAGLAGCLPSPDDDSETATARDAVWVVPFDGAPASFVEDYETNGPSTLYMTVDGGVGAADVRDGNKLWTTDVAGSVPTDLTRDEDLFVLADTSIGEFSSGTVPRLTRVTTDGDVVWEREMSDVDPRSLSRVVDTTSESVLFDANRGLMAVGKENGEPKWSTGEIADYVVADGDLFVTDESGTRRLDGGDGSVVWSVDTTIDTRLAATDRGLLYGMSEQDDGTYVLHRLQQRDGFENWQATLENEVTGGNAVGTFHVTDDHVYVGGNPVRRYSRLDGSPTWEGSVAGGFASAIHTDDYVFFHSTEKSPASNSYRDLYFVYVFGREREEVVGQVTVPRVPSFIGTTNDIAYFYDRERIYSLAGDGRGLVRWRYAPPTSVSDATVEGFDVIVSQGDEAPAGAGLYAYRADSIAGDDSS